MKIKLFEKKEKGIDRFIWGAILLFLASMIFSTFLVQTMVIVLFIAYIVKVSRQKKLEYFSTPLDIPFLVFILARLCSVIFSTDLSVSVLTLNKEIFFYVTFYLFTNLLYKEDASSIKFLFRLIVTAAVVASIYGATKVILGFQERASSTTSGYYTLGTFLTVVFAVTLGLGKSKEFFRERIYWFIILIVLLIGIIFTQNRIHWGIVALVLLFVGILRERMLIIISTVIGAAVIFIVPALRERLAELVYFTKYLSDRDVIWQGAFVLLHVHPITGFGTRTFKNIFPLKDSLEDKGIGSWHSDYLQMYFEGGIITLAAFLWVMISVFYHGIRTFRNKLTKKFDKDLLFAVLLGISVFYMTALVGGFILDPINTLFYQFLMAVAAIIITKGFASE